jgi:hypothetical protein
LTAEVNAYEAKLAKRKEIKAEEELAEAKKIEEDTARRKATAKAKAELAKAKAETKKAKAKAGIDDSTNERLLTAIMNIDTFGN